MVKANASLVAALILVASCSSPKGIVVPNETGDDSADIRDATTDADDAGGPYPDAPSLDDSGVCAPLPGECPPTVPSYATEVAPILDAKCNGCHMAAPDRPWPLTNYEDVHDWGSYIVYDLLQCTMPPADAGVALTASEVNTILTWFVCNAPDN